MQIILGAGGIIGNELAKELPNYTNEIKLVSRHPKKINAGDHLQNADLLSTSAVNDAVKGASVVYLTAGLQYNLGVWQEQWPVIMKNVIDACKMNQAKLVFFDNIYMYGPVNGAMTEETPYHPTSKKGKVRAAIAKMILDEINKGSLTAMICRAPEFYGPRNTLSGVNSLVFDAMKNGKKVQWLVNDELKRTFIYTPDAARATALLANSPDTWNQTWHLPCDDFHPTGKQFMNMVSGAAGREIKYSIMPKWMVRFGGLFNPYAKEIVELLYQYDGEYIFDSSKFKKAFPSFAVTSYTEGIKQVVNEIMQEK